jgi:hypothetical protein
MTSNEQDENPDWARGYPVEELERIADICQEHDHEYSLSVFSKVQERDVATWMDEYQVIAADDWCIVYEDVDRSRRIQDFRREPRGKMQRYDRFVRRVAWRDDDSSDAYSAVRETLGALLDDVTGWVRLWQGHPGDERLADDLGLDHGLTKISAASELEGIWVTDDEIVHIDDLLPEEALHLERASTSIDPDAFQAARDALDRIEEWTGHYSKYGDPDTWSALALRGFGGKTGFIDKPAERNQSWREDNPDKLNWECQDTPLRDELPELDPLIDAVPGRKERIRLMRLGPDDGEIERHADITDPDAGAALGNLMRMHVPLQTNIGVAFTSWNRFGNPKTTHMGAGEIWYLDTRKPHRVINEGSTDRVHLVLDVESNEQLLDTLGVEKQTVGEFF